MTAVERLNERPGAEAQLSLRICLLGYRSDPFCGGQGIYLHYLSKALLKLGHEVTVVSGPPYPQLVSGVQLVCLPSLDLFENGLSSLRPRHLLSWANIVEWCSKATGGFAEPYAFGRRVAAYLKQHSDNFDVVHDNQTLCYSLLQLQSAGTPVLATIHHPISRDLRLSLAAEPVWWRRMLIRRWHAFLHMQKKVARSLQHIATVSECSRADIVREFGVDPIRIAVVPCGIDTEIFKPVPEIKRESNLLLSVASADQPLKGLDYLLRAYSVLIKTRNLRLIVVGAPRENGPTELLLRELGIEQQVQFLKGISTDRLVELYSAATIAIVPSLYEGFGLPAGEAMACQAPLVSTDGGALREVVGNAGRIVPSASVGALVDAITELLEDDKLRESLGLAGYLRIREQFSWRIAAVRFVEKYTAIMADANS